MGLAATLRLDGGMSTERAAVPELCPGVEGVRVELSFNVMVEVSRWRRKECKVCSQRKSYM